MSDNKLKFIPYSDQNDQETESKDLRVLSIDGGGVRGVFPARILFNLQNDTGLPLYQVFDVMAGTSVGAIIASILASGGSIDDALQIVFERANDIFSRHGSMVRAINTPLYESDKLREMLGELVGDITFQELKTDLIVTATEVRSSKPRIYSSLDKNLNIKVIDAVMASAAAPMFFPPQVIGNDILVDGGVWANNPSMVAILDLLTRLGVSADHMKLLSLGTGEKPSYYRDEDPANIGNDWGAIKWSTGIFDVVTALQVSNADYTLGLVLEKDKYMRVNYVSDLKLRLDNTDPANLQFLSDTGDSIYIEKKEDIKDFLRIEDKR